MVGPERPSLSSRGTPGAYGGYFTKEDIREIVTYAAERHITVIPEIEFPAHSDAVFIGYPELCCTGKPYTTGEFCVGNEQVYTFMEDVLTEVMELFPSKYIHIGGDEARKVAWATCPKCQALIERERLDGIQGLQPYMIARIQDFSLRKGGLWSAGMKYCTTNCIPKPWLCRIVDRKGLSKPLIGAIMP